MAELHQYAVSRVRASRVAVVTALSPHRAIALEFSFSRNARSVILKSACVRHPRKASTVLRPIIQHGA